MRHAFAAPRTTTETAIATIWCDLLRLDRVGIDDSFFDLGGTSLALTRAHARLQVDLQPFPIALLFQHPTIRTLAAAIQGTESAPQISPVRNLRSERDGYAIVGMAGRFPGADNIDEFWRNLRDGVESITFFRDDELIAAGVAPELVGQPDYVKVRGLIRDAEGFDAAFFGYPPREAELLDPQHRVFLETAWAALEHAGYDPSRAGGPIGVFAGSSPSTYLMANVCADRDGVAALVGGYQSGGFPALFGNDKDYLATRVAYEMDLRGPSVSVQTACSTALVAVAQACDALAAGRCRMALAGGVSITVPRTARIPIPGSAMVSPDGHCRAFDAAAAGTVFGEGVGIVVLKRLTDAQADGDTIYAVIRGVGVSNDGAAKVSFTAPSVDGQAAAVRQALEQSEVDARTISYIEAHGTGTPLGDPIEIAGLTAAFRGDTSDAGFCAIGSVKTNIGHLEAAAGAAGLIKTVLALQHSQLPPTLHFHAPNGQIDFAASPFVVQDRLTDWPRGSSPRCAGVSALGVGGTNAHVVLEEPPVVASGQSARTSQLLVLSAKTPSALNALSENLARFLEESPTVSLADAAFTLQIGRRAFGHRRAVVADTSSEAARTLRELRGEKAAIENRPVAFLFPGQGRSASAWGGACTRMSQYFAKRSIDAARCSAIRWDSISATCFIRRTNQPLASD